MPYIYIRQHCTNFCVLLPFISNIFYSFSIILQACLKSLIYFLDTFTSLTSSKQSESSQSLDQNNIENMSKQDLLESKKNLAMELLWIQQAIESRKQYLKIRDKLD